MNTTTKTNLRQKGPIAKIIFSPKKDFLTEIFKNKPISQEKGIISTFKMSAIVFVLINLTLVIAMFLLFMRYEAPRLLTITTFFSTFFAIAVLLYIIWSSLSDQKKEDKDGWKIDTPIKASYETRLAVIQRIVDALMYFFLGGIAWLFLCICIIFQK